MEYPHRGQLIDVLVGCSKRCQSNLLGKLGKTLIGQQWHVPKQLVTAIAGNTKFQIVTTKEL